MHYIRYARSSSKIFRRVNSDCLTVTGMVIGLAALGFTSTFPVIVAAPPYNWPIVSIYPLCVVSNVQILRKVGIPANKID